MRPEASAGSRTIRAMNRSGLYWPSRRRLFRRRVPVRVRFATWLVLAAALVLTAAATVHAQ